PAVSWSAIIDNLPLLWSDISLPINLAIGKAFLSLFLPGGPQLDAIIHDALLDPNTSITAGLLNARGDLATAILTANDNCPSELSSQAAAEWANMSHLVDSTPPMTLAGLGELFFGA